MKKLKIRSLVIFTLAASFLSVGYADECDVVVSTAVEKVAGPLAAQISYAEGGFLGIFGKKGSGEILQDYPKHLIRQDSICTEGYEALLHSLDVHRCDLTVSLQKYAEKLQAKLEERANADTDDRAKNNIRVAAAHCQQIRQKLCITQSTELGTTMGASYETYLAEKDPKKKAELLAQVAGQINAFMPRANAIMDHRICDPKDFTRNFAQAFSKASHSTDDVNDTNLVEMLAAINSDLSKGTSTSGGGGYSALGGRKNEGRD